MRYTVKHVFPTEHITRQLVLDKQTNFLSLGDNTVVLRPKVFTWLLNGDRLQQRGSLTV